MAGKKGEDKPSTSASAENGQRGERGGLIATATTPLKAAANLFAGTVSDGEGEGEGERERERERENRASERGGVGFEAD